MVNEISELQTLHKLLQDNRQCHFKDYFLQRRVHHYLSLLVFTYLNMPYIATMHQGKLMHVQQSKE